MEKPIRVNLACGDKHWPGFVNLDNPDLLNLEYDDESVDELHLIHVFEHLPRAKIYLYLKEWQRVLKPGGLLVLEMPLLDKICQMVLDGEKNQQLTLLGIFGNVHKDDPLMWHRWCYAKWELEKVLDGWITEFKDPVFHFEKRDIRIECRRKA